MTTATTRKARFFCAVLCLASTTRATAARRFRKGRQQSRVATLSPLRAKGFATSLPSSGNCTWRYFTQQLDHFDETNAATFSQRVCLYDGFVGGNVSHVLFYTGNESPVEEYVNNTGLAWEVGAELGSLLVFAEHRYEGESVPKLAGVENCMSFCTVEQALADYAALVQVLRDEYGDPDLPFVAIGGSYGGMLSSWFRMLYPESVAGAIAGSAPIWGFPTIDPELDGSSVAIGRNFGKTGGLPNDNCRDNLLGAWPLMTALGETQKGRAFLKQTMGLCDAESTGADVAEAIQSVFFDLAEANYPFASTYITSAVGPGYYPLPPWPIKQACGPLQRRPLVTLTGNVSAVRFTATTTDGLAAAAVDWDAVEALTGEHFYLRSPALALLLRGVAHVWASWCNVTGALDCLSADGACTTGRRRRLAAPREEELLSTSTSSSSVCTARSYAQGSWEPVCCNDDLYLANTYVQGVGRDKLFWPPNVPEDFTVASVLGVPYGETERGCLAGRGLTGYPPTSDPWATHVIDQFGDQSGARNASRLVFSNGLLDPWSAAGVYDDLAPTQPDDYAGPRVQNLSDSVSALILDLGAHHLDLFFLDDNDPDCAFQARDFETAQIKSWLGLL